MVDSRALTRFFLLLAAVSMVLACGRQPSSNIAFETLANGLEHDVVHARAAQSKALFTAYVLKFDPSRWQQRVVGPDLDAPVSDAAGFRKLAGAVAAINAGYFDPQKRPLGLLVTEGKQRSRLRKVDHGVLTVDEKGDVQLQHARDFVVPPRLNFAIECGPRLIVDGKKLTFKPGIARRTAIGYDRDGYMYWVVMSTAISLADLATFLVEPPARGGLGLIGALNLDGGSSTMFDLAVAKTRASIRASVQVPVGLALVATRS